jgi:import inner membrane translocase subunit TIM10
MSFLFGGQPKMSSEQKIAAAETEVEMISDMFNRCVLASPSLLAP